MANPSPPFLSVFRQMREALFGLSHLLCQPQFQDPDWMPDYFPALLEKIHDWYLKDPTGPSAFLHDPTLPNQTLLQQVRRLLSEFDLTYTSLTLTHELLCLNNCSLGDQLPAEEEEEEEDSSSEIPLAPEETDATWCLRDSVTWSSGFHLNEAGDGSLATALQEYVAQLGWNESLARNDLDALLCPRCGHVLTPNFLPFLSKVKKDVILVNCEPGTIELNNISLEQPLQLFGATFWPILLLWATKEEDDVVLQFLPANRFFPPESPESNWFIRFIYFGNKDATVSPFDPELKKQLEGLFTDK